MSFWDAATTEDDINDSIWLDSPAVQEDVQRTDAARRTGVGAQQAMLLPDRPLPWVPDIVGDNWRHPHSLLIVGSAYAPFVQGSAGRANVMHLAAYANARSWQDFQRLFLMTVVNGDRSYYAPLSGLAAATPASHDCSYLALFDLCRVSFTERTGADRYQGGDGVVGRHCELFERYVEHPANQAWLWRRLNGTQGSRIVALGTIAEHGLLRLFAEKGCSLSAGGISARLPPGKRGGWVKRYANAGRKLSGWVDSGQWWEIAAPQGGGDQRRWHLLPVRHPSAYGARDSYGAECGLLQRMTDGGAPAVKPAASSMGF